MIRNYLLNIIPCSFAVIAFSRGIPAMLLPLITLPSAFQLERECRFGIHYELDKHTARLNAYFSMFYILAIALTQRLPGFNYIQSLNIDLSPSVALLADTHEEMFNRIQQPITNKPNQYLHITLLVIVVVIQTHGQRRRWIKYRHEVVLGLHL